MKDEFEAFKSQTSDAYNEFVNGAKKDFDETVNQNYKDWKNTAKTRITSLPKTSGNSHVNVNGNSVTYHDGSYYLNGKKSTLADINKKL